MAAHNFDESLRRLLVHEGGYTNHPSDPGGPTNFGITIHDYRKYVRSGATAADVRAMRLDEAKAIYREKYWNALRCDELPAGVDYAVFDYGVNSGVGRSGKVLRRALSLADVTSAVSDGVVAAARGRNAAQLIAAICDERLAFLKRLRTWPVFGAGWGRRVAEVRTVALAMAKAKPAARPKSGAGAKAAPAAGRGEVPLNRSARNATAGGIVVAGGAAAQQAHHAGVSSVLVIVIVLVTVALAVIGCWWWRRHRNRQQEN